MIRKPHIFNLGFAIPLFAFASFGLIQKYLGIVGCLIYVFSLYGIYYLFVQTPIIKKICEYPFLSITLTILVISYFAFHILFPQWEARVDRNEALDIAVWELLEFEYPYYIKTHLNAPISPFPGAILLAIPFVLLGNSSYQNFFWIVLLVFALAYRFYNREVAVVFLSSILLCLSFLQEWLFGGDLIANNIYVLFGLIWSVNEIVQKKERASLWPALFLGFAFSSRPNFVFWFFPVAAIYLKTIGLKNALKYLASIVFIYSIITLPFFLYDPNNFSPLQATNKIFESYIIQLAMLASMFIVAVPSGYFINDFKDILKWGAFVQFIPVVLVVIIESMNNGHIDFLFTKYRYGLSFVLPGVLWFCLSHFEPMSMNGKRNKSQTQPEAL